MYPTPVLHSCCQEAAAPSQLGPAIKPVLPIAVGALVVVLGLEESPNDNQYSVCPGKTVGKFRVFPKETFERFPRPAASFHQRRR